MKPISLIAGFFTVGLWTMASRVLGFARDICFAAFLGTGPLGEAFVLAFSLPNLFRRFFAEGAFNMAFVPMFAKKLEAGEDAEGFASDALSGLGAILIVLCLLAMLFMPWLVWAMASGFVGDARFDLSVLFGRIAFPYILFISLAALFSGVLNAAGHFRAAAAAPVLLNIIFLAALAMAIGAGWDIGLTISWAVPIAGIAQLGLVWWAARRAGFRLHIRLPRPTPELRRLAWIAAPVALSAGVMQINLLIGRQVASQIERAYAWLYYSDRLYQLPLGVIGIAIGVVLLPELSRRLQSRDAAGGQQAFQRAVEMSMALTLPATVALIVIPMPLISVLFGRGAFDAVDVSATALATAIYALGLPAFVLQKIYQPIYYAREDTRSPFYFALVALVVNAVVAIGLWRVIGFQAAAWGTTIASYAMLICLWAGARRFGGAAVLSATLIRKLTLMLVACAVMAAGLYLSALYLEPLLFLPFWRYPALALLILLGAGFYFAAAFGLGALDRAELRQVLRR